MSIIKITLGALFSGVNPHHGAVTSNQSLELAFSAKNPHFLGTVSKYGVTYCVKKIPTMV